MDRDQKLKRVQLWIAVLAGMATFVVGAYNIKNIFFSKKAAEAPEPVVVKVRPNPLRAAVEDVGASWIKELGTPKQKEEQPSQ